MAFIKNCIKKITRKNLKKFVGITLTAWYFKVNGKTSTYQPLLLNNSSRPVIERIVKQDSNSSNQNILLLQGETDSIRVVTDPNSSTKNILLLRGGINDKTGPMGKALGKVQKNFNPLFNPGKKSSNLGNLNLNSNKTSVTNTTNTTLTNYSRSHTPSGSELPIPPKPRVRVLKNSSRYSSATIKDKSSSESVTQDFMVKEQVKSESTPQPKESKPEPTPQQKESKQEPTPQPKESKQEPTGSPTRESIFSYKTDSQDRTYGKFTDFTLKDLRIEQDKNTKDIHAKMSLNNRNVRTDIDLNSSKLKKIGEDVIIPTTKEMLEMIKNGGKAGEKLVEAMANKTRETFGNIPNNTKISLPRAAKTSGDMAVLYKLVDMDKKLINQAAGCLGQDISETFFKNMSRVASEACFRQDDRYKGPCNIIKLKGANYALDVGLTLSPNFLPGKDIPAVKGFYITSSAVFDGYVKGALHKTANYIIQDDAATTGNIPPFSQNSGNGN